MTVFENSILRSAITNGNNEVDAGYLALVWALGVWTLMSVVTLIAGTWLAFLDDAANLVSATGVALAAEAGTFATIVGAVGLFRMGDKPRAVVAAALPPAPAVIVQTGTQPENGVKPLPVKVVAMPAKSAPPERGKKKR